MLLEKPFPRLSGRKNRVLLRKTRSHLSLAVYPRVIDYQVHTVLQVKGVGGGGGEVPHLRSIFSEFLGVFLFVAEFSMNQHIYATLQGGLVLWYFLSSVAALLFVTIVPFLIIPGRRYRLFF